VKIIFCAYRREKLIGLHQTNIKMIFSPSYIFVHKCN